MPLIPFASLPDNARVWVFGASQPVLGSDADTLIAYSSDFVRTWLAHGAPVVGACDWRYDHFLLIAADEEATGVSGCSIDALFRTLRGIEGELGVTLLDSSLVFFRDTSDNVQALPRPDFRKLVQNGDVGDCTIVFDNTVGAVGALKNGSWERRFAGSWHERAFRRVSAHSSAVRTE